MNLYCSGYTERCDKFKKYSKCYWRTPEGIKEWFDKLDIIEYRPGFKTLCCNTSKHVYLIPEFEFKMREAIKRGKKNGYKQSVKKRTVTPKS